MPTPVNVEPLQVGTFGLPPEPCDRRVNQWFSGPAAACTSVFGMAVDQQAGSPRAAGLYMLRIGPLPVRLTSSPTRKSGGSFGLLANASVRAPKMSPVASLMPPFSLPLPAPPGVVWKMAWPYSCATTSIGVTWRWLSEDRPKLVKLPFQNALTWFRPTRAGKPPPLPLMPLRPSHVPSMSHSRCTA